MTTWIVVAAVGLVGGVAVVDGLRTPAESPGSERRTGDQRDERERRGIATALAERGIRGVLTYSGEDCRLRAVTLPVLESHPAPNARTCQFVYSAGTFSLGSTVRHPTNPVLAARCENGFIKVTFGEVRARSRGCRPTWKPSGILTAVRDGEVVELDFWPERSRLIPRVVLPRRGLVRAFRRVGWVGFVFSIERFAWVTETRVAAIVHAASQGESLDLLVLIQDGRLVREPSRSYPELTGLRVSPRGRYVAAYSEEGVVVLGRDGRFGPLPVPGNAIAWSPDERWAAVADQGAISFFRPRDGWILPTRIPIAASDLIWR